MEVEQAAQSAFGKIGVLMGGASSEREISLKSGKAVYESLRQNGFAVAGIDIQTELRGEVIALIKSQGLDCAFIALHGRFGEDGQIQEILEELHLPYTGSGVLASRLAMDKIASRKIFQEYGLCVPAYRVAERVAYEQERSSLQQLRYPVVVKPSSHGSSIGLSIIDVPALLEEAVETAFQYDERILIEDYIPGREMTVGILGDEPLPVIEIVPKKRFFDYEAKYQPGMTDYIVPAQIEKEISQKIQSVATSAHRSLGCRGCSRADMILGTDNKPYILEINTIPGLTETSLLPRAAKQVGLDYCQLCVRLLELAYEKVKA